MRQYNFLWKPFFFICSLLFATWLVITVEKVSPSDLGVEQPSKDAVEPVSADLLKRREYLKQLCDQYKAGAIDSTEVNKRLLFFLTIDRNGKAK